MHTQTLLSTVSRLVVGAACVIASASCGGELLRTGRAPVYLSIVSLSSANSSVLRSDVAGATAVSSDIGTAIIRVEAKNPASVTAPLNAVTITRYHVEYRRSDGRNIQGTDVPYGFDGAVTATIAAGSAATVDFELVRRQAKQEPPLMNMTRQGGLIFLNTIAQVTFYGRDQNGNEVSVTGSMDVVFGDF